MFESIITERLNKTLKHIGALVLIVEETNTQLVKEKLSLYKKLSKNPNREDLIILVNIIKTQREQIALTDELLSQSEFVEYRDTYENEIVTDLFQKGNSLMIGLVRNLNQQYKLFTNKNQNLSEQPSKFRTLFKEELAVYKEYQTYVKRIPAHTLEKMLEKAADIEAEKRPFTNVHVVLGALLLIIILNAIEPGLYGSIMRNPLGIATMIATVPLQRKMMKRIEGYLTRSVKVLQYYKVHH